MILTQEIDKNTVNIQNNYMLNSHDGSFQIHKLKYRVISKFLITEKIFQSSYLKLLQLNDDICYWCFWEQVQSIP